MRGLPVMEQERQADAKPSFEAGIACTLAELVRMGHIGAVEVRDLLDGIGMDMDGLAAAGAATEDIDLLTEMEP